MVDEPKQDFEKVVAEEPSVSEASVEESSVADASVETAASGEETSSESMDSVESGSVEAETAEPEAIETDTVEVEESAEVESAETEAVETETTETSVVETESTEAESTETESDETSSEAPADETAADSEEITDTEEEEAEPAPRVKLASGAIEEVETEESAIVKDWYILKVQSNRERSILEALKRKIAIEGLEEYFDEILVPTEKITEFKGGKKKIIERKLFPGYIVVHMEINDDTWFAVRETSGIGDFTGTYGKPTPMLPHEVARILPKKEDDESEEAPKLDIKFKVGDKVKVTAGNFESYEGDVHLIDEQSGRITVMLSIFGRSTPVELEYWQVETV